MVNTHFARKMQSIVYLFLIGVFVHSANASNRGFILTAPKRLLAGSVESICISLHNTTGPARISLDLLHTDTDEKIAFTQHTVEKDNECIEMIVPSTTVTKGRLHLQATFDQMYNYSINSMHEIEFQHNPYITLIQTDKPVYKPGQLVQFRIMILDHDLKPIIKPIPKVWLENPSEVRLAQWLDVKTKKGLVHLEFQLSQEPIQGFWNIKVDRNGSLEVKSFKVMEYVLPRFEVIITPPVYIRADAEMLTWKICAKYSYGQPVKGRIHINATPEIFSWLPVCNKKSRKGKKLRTSAYYVPYDGCIEPPLAINVDKAFDGCYMLNVTGQELGLSTLDKHHNAPNSIKVTATVTEANTDLVRNATTSDTIIHQALNLEFTPHSSPYFKPGLPYQGKVRVLFPNSVPAPEEEIQVCLSTELEGNWQRNLVGCRNFTSDANGFVHYTVPAQQNITTVVYSLTATAVHYEPKYYLPEMRWNLFMNQPTVSHNAKAWYSPSNSYIEIADDAVERPRCNYHHVFRVHLAQHENLNLPTFYFLVKARGDLILSGQVHPLPVNDEQINDTTIRSNSSTAAEMDTSTRVAQFGLKLLITPKMSPISQLMVYFVRSDGETVAATFEIKTEQCFANKVSAGWQHEQQAPGSQSVLHLAAAPHSLCSVSAVDKSTSFLAESTGETDVDMVFKRLDRFQVKDTNTWNYWEKVNYCQDDVKETTLGGGAPVADGDLRRKRSMFFPGYHVRDMKVDALQAFDDFGVVVMSNLAIKTKPCVPHVRPDFDDGPVHRLMLDLAPQARSFGGGAALAIPEMAVASFSPVLTQSGGYSPEDRSAAVEVRSFFPETWLWELVITGREGRAQVRSEVPHTITDWVGSAVCISAQQGLGMSTPTKLTAFQPFFLELALPYSVKRGEVVQIKVALFNFLPHSLPVRITFQLSPGIELLSDESSVSECVSENANWVHRYRVRASDLGEVNLTVSAEVDSEFGRECGPEVIVGRRDVLIKPLLVKPEGFPVEVTKSAFICPSAESSSEDKSVFWNLELPSDVVAGSARAEVNMAADLMGPTLQNLDKLVQMPMGCGEQNMVLFVPNLHVVNYLTATYQTNPTLLAEAITNMKKGYQRELNYRHTDGSYSAFGNSDPEGSMWLTSFVVKTFAQARTHIFIDEIDLKVSLDWISKKQLENGCFPVVGQVLHKDMKGGLVDDGSTSALTAYVLISLLETGLPLPSTLASNAVFCLRADVKQPDVYTMALTTYALTLLADRHVAREAMTRLMANAVVQQELIYWEKPGSKSMALSVEITAYAILALVKLGGEDNIINAHKAVRWISQHRNAHGGFISTQDTVVALEALSKYAASLPAGNTLLSVLVTSADLERSFQIRPDDRLLLQRQRLPTLPTQVEVTAEGDGCVLVQSWLRYNVHTARGDDALEMTVSVKPLASVDMCSLQRIDLCVRYKPEGQASNMAVLEVQMASGYLPEKESLKLLDTNSKIKRWEVEKDQVNFYFDSLSNAWLCVSLVTQQEMKIENPAASNVRLYDYYEPEITISKNYQVEINCDIEPLPNPVPVGNESANNTMGTEMPTVGTDPILTHSENLIAENFVMERPKPFVKIISEEDSPIARSLNALLPNNKLNPDFVDVSHELATPDGDEGPIPVYTQPENQPLSQENLSCPNCWNKFPSNFSSIYCNSASVYKAVMRKPGVVRLLLDLTPSKLPSRLRRLVKIMVPSECDCPPLQDNSANSTVLMIFDQPMKDVNIFSLSSMTNLWRVPTVQGQPRVVKNARSKCQIS